MEVEAFPIRFTRGIRSYWRRRKYHRLDGAGGSKTRPATQQLGARRRGGAGWGVRLRRLLRVRVVRAPARVLRRIRDAYVGAMLAVANKTVTRKRLPASAPSEFEKRLILEIYKSIVQSKELTTMLHSSTAHLPAPAHSAAGPSVDLLSM